MITLIAGSLICFMGYCAALIDWVQDAQTGVYQRNPLEAVLETFAIGAYTYFAIRFIQAKSSLL